MGAVGSVENKLIIWPSKALLHCLDELKEGGLAMMMLLACFSEGNTK
jgi:hypothetical protein